MEFRYSGLGVSEDFLFRMGSFFGTDKNINQMCEECAELMVALNHFRRGKATVDDVALEIADVIMMAEELRLMFGPDLVDQKLKSQVEVVEKRVKDGRYESTTARVPSPF